LQAALLQSLSHDLRTPLAIITVALSNLETAGERLDEATRQALARTGRHEAERLNRLLGDLLEISRIEAGALRVSAEPCDVEEVVGVALDRVAPEAEEQPVGVEGVVDVDERPVAVEIPPGLAAVPMDLALMAQALANVLDNAVKYSPPGTQIDIIVRQAGDEVTIQVGDRGAGVRPEDLAHIFDKFYRGQQPGNAHGSGLGLAISKGIVEAHGGRIWAAERPGGGTMVTIALPLARPAPAGEG
jgi:two-component system sensor histidine kinase KdpD